MRRPALLLAATLFAAPALAQVTVNQGALDALGKSEPAHARREPARPAHPDRHPPAHPEPAKKPSAPGKPGSTATQPAKPPTVPATPPAILALPPPVQVPVMHPPPPPPVPVTADALGTATPIPGGVRVTFGSDSSDLNPATVAALRTFADSVKANEATSINVYAYAAGVPEDPSTPRRLSLSRALAARAVLINDGIVSPRIYPRALGAAGGSTDPDRVDVIAGPQAPPAPAAPAPAAHP